MLRQLFCIAAVLLSAEALANDPQWCSLQAQQAYNQVYNDCMAQGPGPGGQQACENYTVNGEYACRDHSWCNWSYTSSACYNRNANFCDYYTRHGEYACKDNPTCGWSYSASACYDKQGQFCEYYNRFGEYACRDNPACNWSYESNSCYSR
jgi:hypothetical protein